MASRAEFFLNFLQTLTIRNKDAGQVAFTLNAAQQHVWAKYIAPALDRRQPLRFVILKARQMGISTLLQGLLTTRFVWDNLVNEKVIAHEGDSTKNIWGMAERMMDHSPFSNYVRKVGTTMELGDSRYSCATAGSPHATRGMNITCLHLSEVAFWPHPEAWLAALQTVPIRGESWVFVESTANGKTEQGQLFYEEWKRAQAGDSSFTPVFLPWYDLKEYALENYIYSQAWTHSTSPDMLVLEDLDPEETALKQAFALSAGQLAWRRLIIADQCRGDVELFHQEYPSTPEEAFIQSGLPLFSGKDLYPFHKHIRKGARFRLNPNGRFEQDPNGYVEIWQQPQPGHQYIIGADTSMGFTDESHSRSAAEIIDLETMEQVGEYDCASPTHVMARHLAILGRRYNEALLAPEITASGGGGGRELLVYLLKDHAYYNIYRYKQVDHVKPDQGRMWGWETNSKTRPRMLARVVEAIKERACVIHSEVLLNQLQSFGENDSGRLEALAGHDDLLFAFGIAVTVRSEEYLSMVSEETKRTATREQLQGVGVEVQRDVTTEWANDWEQRYSKTAGRKEVSWQAL